MKIENSNYLRITLFGAFAALCACSMWAFPIQASIFHVAVNGQDSTSCQKATNPKTPRQSIGASLRCLGPGDTLYVHAGTYAESILSWKTKIPNGKSWEQPIRIAAYPGDTVIITPRAKQAFFWIQDGEAKYLIIEGFVIDGLQEAQHGFKFSNHSTHIRVKQCEIKNTFDNGILVSICTGCANPGQYPHDTYHEFLGLDVHHNGAPPSPKNAHGFYIETSHNLVEHGKFHHNAGNGGKFYHGNLPGVANHNIARHNEFYDNSQSGKWSCGLILSSGEGNEGYNNTAYGNFAGFCILSRVINARLYNNITYENDIYGIYVGKETTDQSHVENNTVYKNGVYGIFVGDGATETTVINNISYLNKVQNIGLKDQTGSVVSHNFIGDPKFINAENHDFRLQPGSPAIGGGISVKGITRDFEGKERLQEKLPDIGAFEYQGIKKAQQEAQKALADVGQREPVSSQFNAPEIKPTLISPPAGSVLSGPTETFSWRTVPSAQEYFLQIGTGLGQLNEPLTKNIFNATVPASQDSVVVHQLPTNGIPLYVRFWYKEDNQWVANEPVLFSSVTLDSGNSTDSHPVLTPTLISPPAGSILSGPTETFSWSSPPSVQEYFLQIGTGLGQPNDPVTNNIFSATIPASQDSVVVHQLPTNGMPLYVRFWYKEDNQWIANDQLLYRASSFPAGSQQKGPR